MTDNIFFLARDAILAECVGSKKKIILKLQQNITEDNILKNMHSPVENLTPGKPPKPSLVAPKSLKKRKLNSEEGLAALMHSIAHIEFNAINLALDAFYRFRGLPYEYYTNWLQVAFEEAYHFSLIENYLNKMDYKYGDFPAHNGLWEMAEDTSYDVLARMALVPRVMEARGLDASSIIKKRLSAAGKQEAVEILDIIETDEVQHVLYGSNWYKYICKTRNIPVLKTFKDLVTKHASRVIKLPLREDLRLKAGFTKEENAMLIQIACKDPKSV